MRKRNISYTLDKLFWWFLALLPVITYLIFVAKFIGNNGFDLSTYQYHQNIDFDLFMSNFFGVTGIVPSVFSDIFAEDGLFPIFSSYGLFDFLAWFVGVNLLHLTVDFILFIPRLAHKWLGNFTNSEG